MTFLLAVIGPVQAQPCSCVLPWTLVFALVALMLVGLFFLAIFFRWVRAAVVALGKLPT